MIDELALAFMLSLLFGIAVRFFLMRNYLNKWSEGNKPFGKSLEGKEETK